VVHKWLLAHPRVQLHFTPTYSSWIGQVERWLAELQRRCLDRGVFCSLDELTTALENWIKTWNAGARRFKWTKTADQGSGARAEEARVGELDDELELPHPATAAASTAAARMMLGSRFGPEQPEHGYPFSGAAASGPPPVRWRYGTPSNWNVNASPGRVQVTDPSTSPGGIGGASGVLVVGPTAMKLWGGS